MTDELPVTGDLNAAALASARQIDPAQWASDAPIMGLVREAGYVWGTLRARDGTMFSLMRRFTPGADLAAESSGERRGLGGRLIVMSTVDAEGVSTGELRVRREPKDAVPSDLARREALPDGVRFSAPSGDAEARHAS
ncbi:hypothetical protein [Streptomyces sp. KL116D]|uniref:hypothetical protein n=1 Tax=Streptomyces sp. KL116D TaxID=3045152 RepID=UPI0035560846